MMTNRNRNWTTMITAMMPIPLTSQGKYDSKGKKKGKEGCCRYRDDNKIKALQGLYEEPKYDVGDRGDHDDD